MRFERVLLVNPPSSSYLGGARLPSGLGYIAQALLESDISYDVLDMRMRGKFSDLEQKIQKFSPDLIGFSLISLEYKKSYGLITRVKDVFPKVKVVAGGPHLITFKEKVLVNCPAIDYGVIHEGEETIVELCDNKDESEIKGLIFRKDRRPIFNGYRDLSMDLDKVSFPRYERFKINRYTKGRPLITSRGCPFRCIFCPNNLITKKFRPRSASHVVDEIEYWYDKGIRQFNIDDDNFTLIKERVYEICDEIERRNLKNLFLRASNGVRADKVDRDLLKRMREVGFFEIGFGVDGGNNKVLKIIKKGENIETIEQAIKDACDLGYDVKLFFLIGSPGETKEDIEDSIQLVEKYPIQRVNLNNPIPYPGTELFEWVKKNSCFLREPDDYLNSITEDECFPLFETPELSKEDRIKILKRCSKIENKITRNAVKRMYGKNILLRTLGAYLFATEFGERLYFKNLTFRKIIERLRYKKALGL